MNETSQCAGDARKFNLYSSGAVERGKASERIKLAVGYSLHYMYARVQGRCNSSAEAKQK